jgi:hypothetical protein
MQKTDLTERAIYAQICSHDGILAREIARAIGIDRKTVNHYLYASPYMHELCYRDDSYLWHGYIRQTRPHTGLGDFTGYYASAGEFMQQDEESWFAQLTEGCSRIGRNLNDTRGLFHSFRDARSVVRDLFADLERLGISCWKDWEVAFELRINRAKWIRIYADVLIITGHYVFSLEFKMKDKIDPEEVSQAAKYSPYLEVLFGPGYDVIPVLVLTRASDLYTYAPLPGTSAEIPVCSGDMLFNIFDEYMGFLED